MTSPKHLAVRGGAAVLAVGFAALVILDARTGTLRDGQVGTTIGWLLLAFAGYALVMAGTQRSAPKAAGRESWKWLLVFGLALRLALLGTTPTLSDDVYRYLWEGHLVTEGVSPYAFAIEDPAGDPYDIAARDSVNNRSLASPYLPFVHAVFAVATLLLPSHPASMQLVMIAFDVLGAAMIMRVLTAVGLPERRVLLYWLNPLVIVEVAHGAHIDAIIVGLTLAAVSFTLKRTTGLAGAAAPLLLAMSTLTRPLALFLMPVLWWLWTWRQRALWVGAVSIPIAVIGAVSGLGLNDDGTGVFGSSRAYTRTFRFNGGIYHWVEAWIGSRGLDDMGWNEPMMLTRLGIGAVSAIVLFVIFGAAWHRRDPVNALRLMAVSLGAYVLLAPVLHPWYLLLLLAFVPFVAPGDREVGLRWLLALPWLALSAWVVFSYLTYRDPDAFAELPWVRRLTWWPTFALLAVAAGWRLRCREKISGRPVDLGDGVRHHS